MVWKIEVAGRLTEAVPTGSVQSMLVWSDPDNHRLPSICRLDSRNPSSAKSHALGINSSRESVNPLSIH